MSLRRHLLVTLTRHSLTFASLERTRLPLVESLGIAHALI